MNTFEIRHQEQLAWAASHGYQCRAWLLAGDTTRAVYWAKAAAQSYHTALAWMAKIEGRA